MQNDIFRELGILKVRDVIKVHQLKLVYDFLNGRLPSDLMYGVSPPPRKKIKNENK